MDDNNYYAFYRSIFQSYDDPAKAQKIWDEYHPELVGLGIEERALKIANECRTSDRLDVELDQIFSAAKLNLVCVSSNRHRNFSDSEGVNEDGIRALEDM
jgi:hypothetical protein